MLFSKFTFAVGFVVVMLEFGAPFRGQAQVSDEPAAADRMIKEKGLRGIFALLNVAPNRKKICIMPKLQDDGGGNLTPLFAYVYSRIVKELSSHSKIQIIPLRNRKVPETGKPLTLRLAWNRETLLPSAPAAQSADYLLYLSSRRRGGQEVFRVTFRSWALSARKIRPVEFSLGKCNLPKAYRDSFVSPSPNFGSMEWKPGGKTCRHSGSARLEIDRPARIYEEGDKLVVFQKTPARHYLNIFLVDQSGGVEALFPRKPYHPDSLIVLGESYLLTFTSPFGPQRLISVISEKPLPLRKSNALLAKGAELLKSKNFFDFDSAVWVSELFVFTIPRLSPKK